MATRVCNGGKWSSGRFKTWQAKRDNPVSKSERGAFMRRAEETQNHADAERKKHHATAPDDYTRSVVG